MSGKSDPLIISLPPPPQSPREMRRELARGRTVFQTLPQSERGTRLGVLVGGGGGGGQRAVRRQSQRDCTAGRSSGLESWDREGGTSQHLEVTYFSCPRRHLSDIPYSQCKNQWYFSYFNVKQYHSILIYLEIYVCTWIVGGLLWVPCFSELVCNVCKLFMDTFLH